MADPDAWTAYLRRVRAAQEEMRHIVSAAKAVFDEATKDERAARDAVVKPAESAFERERMAAWDEYKARVADADYVVVD
jgi:hypothetical protein